jgi:ribokinase
MGPMVISVIGYIDMDLYMTTPRLPDPGESLQAKSYTSSPGGKGANAAVAAFRSSHVKVVSEGQCRFERAFEDIDIEVRMIGAVGGDPNGQLAKDNLKANGVDISGVQTLENELTGVCFCIIESLTGENRLLFTTGATEKLMPEEFMTAEQLGNGVRPDLVISQLEVQREAVEQILRTAHEARIEVLLNAAPAQQILSEMYEYITHLIVNETEAAMLSGVSVEEVNKDTWAELAEDYLEAGVQNVVITLGEQGAYYANAQGAGHIPAEKVNVMDTTGAG